MSGIFGKCYGVVAALLAVTFLSLSNTHAETIIVFGDAEHGVSDPGDWADNSFTGLGLGEHYQSGANNNATSMWSFSGLANGTYYVSANWTAEPNRTTTARFTVSDGLGDVVVDQQNSTRDFYELVSGKPIGWKNLGQVTVSDGDLTVSLADDGDALTSDVFMMADSIRISTMPGVSTLPGLGKGTVVDDGDPTHTFLGEGTGTGANGGDSLWIWNNYGYNTTVSGYNQDHWYDLEDGAASHSGVLGSEWTFDGLTPGVPVDVSTTWLPHANRGQNVPYTISGIDGGDQTVLVNQELEPLADAYELDDFGIAKHFQSLGTFVPMGTSITVTMTNGADEFVIADAVRVARVPEPATATLVGLGVLCLGIANRRKS
ncbi:PEP-CTERM sorting domain-containing protein [Aeoliella sp.]|uniref:golvesin C-terminal-like domain-containing protein n=1 Tax=Aeoliella sp. TaxID=2795800 RepID=UPI003CCBE4E5